MRNTFSEALYSCAKADPKIYIVVADISPAGSMAAFQTEYPERFINVGVAEQTMIGIAAGLALKGCQPFAYTIATFSLYRPFEMIRDDLCYQSLPVTVVGMGASVIYSTLGGTHHTMEDIAVAGAIPNMQIIAPCDPLEVICQEFGAGVKTRYHGGHPYTVGPRHFLTPHDHIFNYLDRLVPRASSCLGYGDFRLSHRLQRL